MNYLAYVCFVTKCIGKVIFTVRVTLTDIVEPYNNLYNYGAKCGQQCTKSTSIDSKQYIMLTKE